MANGTYAEIKAHRMAMHLAIKLKHKIQLTFSALLFVFCLVAILYAPSFAVESTTVKESGDSLLKIVIKTSEPCGLVEFLDTISGRHHTTSWFKDWYWKHAEPTTVAGEKAMLVTYRSLMDAPGHEDQFTDVTGRKLDLNQKILCLASESQGLPQLLAKIKTIVNAEEYERLQTILDHFDPVYQNLVWKPRLAGLDKQMQECNEQIIKCKMRERLTAAGTFMKAPWLPDLPFTVVILPLPIEHGHSHGESLGPVQLVELSPRASFAKKADVIFHEACHALWFSKKDVEQANKEFVTADGKKLPLTELFEGMATALAQGWFSQQAFGKTSANWYADKIINSYSQAVYPLYAEYLNNGRTMDDDFARRATDVYYSKFPDAENDKSVTSLYLVMADNIADLAALKSGIYKRLPRLRSCALCAPFDAAESLKQLHDYEGSHVALLCDLKAVDRLVTLGLKPSQIDFLRSCPRPAALQVGDKQIVFCLADTSAKQQQMLFDCLKKSKWPKPLVK